MASCPKNRKHALLLPGWRCPCGHRAPVDGLPKGWKLPQKITMPQEAIDIYCYITELYISNKPIPMAHIRKLERLLNQGAKVLNDFMIELGLHMLSLKLERNSKERA